MEKKLERGESFYHWPFFPAKNSWQVSSLRDASECEIFWGTAKTAVSWQSCFRIWIPRTKTINPFDHYRLQCVPYDHRLWCSWVEIETTKDWGGLIEEDRTEKREWLKSGSGRKSGSDSFVTFVPHAPRPPLPFPKSAPSSSHDQRIVPTVVHSSSTRERARRQFCFELVVKTMTQWFTLLDGEACWGSAQLSDNLPDELVHGYLVADTHSLCLSCSRIPLHAQCPRPRIFSCRPKLSFVRSR